MVSKLFVLLQRPNSKKDDTLCVTREQSGLFTLTYTDNDSAKFTTKVLPHLSRRDIMHYMKRVVQMNLVDKEHFEYIQLLAPALPSTLFEGLMSEREQNVFLNSIELALTFWPMETE